MRRLGVCLAGLVLVCVMLGQAEGGPIALVVHADSSSYAQGARDRLFATGRFDSVSLYYAGSSTPSLATLSPYDCVLAYSNYVWGDSVAMGNVLADYVDGGGHLVLSTYAFSSMWAIGGKITDPGYSPLVKAGTGDVSGNLVATVPADPIFDGIALGSVSYYHNSNFAHPTLDPGATLLATDGSGHNMIAVNLDEDVIALNLFPGDIAGNNDELYDLLANALLRESEPDVIPEPCTLALFGLGGFGLLIRRRKAR